MKQNYYLLKNKKALECLKPISSPEGRRISPWGVFKWVPFPPVQRMLSYSFSNLSRCPLWEGQKLQRPSVTVTGAWGLPQVLELTGDARPVDWQPRRRSRLKPGVVSEAKQKQVETALFYLVLLSFPMSSCKLEATQG